MKETDVRIPEASPEPVRDQLSRFVLAVGRILSGDLKGVYLHGSLAMGCFNPRLSDLDLLVATIKPMRTEKRRRIAECMLSLSNKPTPIELSVLTAEDRCSWRHPLPYDFHYS